MTLISIPIDTNHKPVNASETTFAKKHPKLKHDVKKIDHEIKAKYAHYKAKLKHKIKPMKG